MLVYANCFAFEPSNGPQDIIDLVAAWIGRRAKSYVDPKRLAAGIRELRLKDGSTLVSRSTVPSDGEVRYPYYFCSRLTHGDDSVSGRRWIAEVGLQQKEEGAYVECSILLRTDEVSARVTSPIQVTRPKLIQQLVEQCHPVGETPGITIKRLNEDSASAFLREVERNERRSPIVVVSCTKEGAYPVAPERLRSLLVGLADVVQIPVEVDTFRIEAVVGRRYMAFGGAVNILFPCRRGERGDFYETVLLRLADLERLGSNGLGAETEVLAAVTHRTNLPYSWRHISLETVSHALLRSQLALTLEKAKGTASSSDVAEYIALLEEADSELLSKDDQIARLRDDLEEQGNEARKLKADIENLKHALSGRQLGESSQNDEVAIALAPLRKSVTAVLNGSPSLEQALELVAALYSEQIVVLDSAFDSAKESDRGGFRFGGKAYELLVKLATDYWQCLVDGKGDQQAKNVFGQNAYAANEASALSNDGKRRRTFSYHGRELVMEKHVKHGIKDSLAETLRVHFEWIAAEKKIVIGHCGKHLDF